MSDPEAVDRMCKKISQLTRVIYLLNTKNDESNALIKALYKTYDKEMETLRKNANDTISNLQKKIDKPTKAQKESAMKFLAHFRKE